MESVLHEQYLQQLPLSTVPPEQDNTPTVIADQSDDPEKVSLFRGQHRITFKATGDGSEHFVRNQLRSVRQGNEQKRVFIYKLDSIPTEAVDPATGHRIHDYTAVFRVLDNPLPLVPIVWGLSIIGSGVAGWFLVDKVESFAQKGPGALLVIAASVLGIWAVLRD